VIGATGYLGIVFLVAALFVLTQVAWCGKMRYPDGR
jgi:hypothetical protein